MLLRFTAFALSALLAGCSGDALTELVVVVDSELAVPTQLDEVTILVEGNDRIPQMARAVLSGAGAVALPATLGLRPSAAGAPQVTIRAHGSHASTRRVSAEVRTTFVEGRRLVVRIVLRSACIDVTCDPGSTCAPTGECVSSLIDPSTLPPFTGLLPRVDLGVRDASTRDLGVSDLGDGDLGGRDLGADLGRADLGVDAGRCGGIGDVCCAGGICAAGAVCNLDTCSRCGAPGELCCPGAICSGAAYCESGLCWAMPQFAQAPVCADFGVPHPAPDYLSQYTVTGRPGAQIHKWNAHVSCAGTRATPMLAAETEGSPVFIGADGTVTLTFPLDMPVTDCAFANLGMYDSWATVDGQSTNHQLYTGYNSMCGGPTGSCAAAMSYCPP